MIQTVNLHDFRQAFHNMGRGDQFSYEGLEIIYDYLEECDPDMELDVIAICCDFSEASIKELIDAFDIDLDGIEADEIDEAVLDYINDHSIVLGVTYDGSIVFQNF